MSSLERAAIQRLLDQAGGLGVDIPPEITDIMGRLGCSSWPASRWVELHPDDEDGAWCCEGAVYRGHIGCTCWTPEYDDVQATDLQPVTGPQDLVPQARMCGDCAFRKGSPERREDFLEEELLALPGRGTPFFCHEGMLKPARWRHPDGRVVEGSPDDWRPPMLGGVPYRLDGRPGLLCAGWMARAARPRRGAS